MIWIAPSEKDTDNAALERRRWDTADQFRASPGLKPQEYSGPKAIVPTRPLVENFCAIVAPV